MTVRKPLEPVQDGWNEIFRVVTVESAREDYGVKVPPEAAR